MVLEDAKKFQHFPEMAMGADALNTEKVLPTVIAISPWTPYFLRLGALRGLLSNWCWMNVDGGKRAGETS